MIKKLLLASCGAIALGACGSVGGSGDDRYEPTAGGRGFITAAPFSFDNNPLIKIDLMNLIDPENRRAALQSEGVCAANNRSKPAIRGTIDTDEFGAVERYLKTLLDEYARNEVRLEREELSDEIRKKLLGEQVRIAGLIFNIEQNKFKFDEKDSDKKDSDEKDSDSRENRKSGSIEISRSKSVKEMRNNYISQRYKYVTGRLLNPNLSDADRKKFEKEKKKLEAEVKNISDSLDSGDGSVNASIELNCALFAFYTYYLSYPQFSFAINDLSFIINNDYLNSKAYDLSGFGTRGGADWPTDSKSINKAQEFVESLSEYEQARLRAYLATGLYDKIYSQAAKSVAIAMRRNSVQDQIMVHSEYYCRYYKARLHDLNISVNLATGLAATALSGLATIFTDPTTVRALAGSAGIVASGRSQFNETMFSNLAIQTVIAGIDVSRENVLRKINKSRFFPLDKDDMDELKSLPNGGVMNPGMFNTYGIRASIQWGDLYGEDEGKLTYAGAPVRKTRDKIGNLVYEPPVFTMADLFDRVALQEAAAESAGTSGDLVAVNDEYETKEDTPKDLPVLDNDLKTQGDTIIINEPKASNGSIKLSDDKKTIIYTPKANFHGIDTIWYKIADGKEGEPNYRTSRAAVRIRVIPDGNEPPAKKYLGLASVGVYTLEAALRDAIKFQTECSLASGLTAATESLKETQAPSVETLTNSIDKMKQMMEATKELRDALDAAATKND